MTRRVEPRKRHLRRRWHQSSTKITNRRFFMTFSPLAVILLLISSLCHASAGQTFFVGPEGSDQNSGASWDKAWKTLEKAGKNATRGDTAIMKESRDTASLPRSTSFAPYAFRGLYASGFALPWRTSRLRHCSRVQPPSTAFATGIFARDWQAAPSCAPVGAVPPNNRARYPGSTETLPHLWLDCHGTLHSSLAVDQ